MIPHIESELCWDHGCPEDGHRPPGYMVKVGDRWASTIPKLILGLDLCGVPVLSRFAGPKDRVLPCGKPHPCPRHSGPRLHRYPPPTRWDQDWGWAVS